MKILGFTYEGRPIVDNGDGSVSTERTETIQDPRLNQGQYTNIPMMWGGQEVDIETALMNAMKTPEQFPGYSDLMQAEMAAQKRSQMLGEQIDAGRYWHGPIPRPVPNPRR